jgi:hypothetical protein
MLGCRITWNLRNGTTQHVGDHNNTLRDAIWEDNAEHVATKFKSNH